MATQVEIYSATDTYVEALKEYNITGIVQEFVSKYNSKQIYVFDYFGWLPFGGYTMPSKIKNMKLWNTNKRVITAMKPKQKWRYNIGMLSISHGYTEDMTPEIANEQLIFHYLGFILDNFTKEVWILDSLSSDPIKEDYTGFVKFLNVVYPKYTVKGVQICSGCGTYEPAYDLDLRDQNIFCHTWTLYFIYMIIKGIYLGLTIENVITYFSYNCKTPVENLKLIKSFAEYVYDNFLDETHKLDPAFSLIFIPIDETAYFLSMIPQWSSPF